MEDNQTRFLVRGKRIIGIVLIVLLLLLVPLVAMQFTDEIKWDITDFLVASGLLFGTGLIYELFILPIKETQRRIILTVLLLILLLVVWAEFAIGIFGTPFGGSNYFD